MQTLIEEYAQDRRALKRSFDIPLSQLKKEKLSQNISAWLDKLDAVDFDSLCHDGKAEYILFQNLLRYEQRAMALEEEHVAECLPLLPFSNIIVEREEQRRMMQPADPEYCAAQLTEIGRLATIASQEEFKKTCEQYKLSVVKRAADLTGDLHETLKKWYTFYNGYDPMFTWWCAEPYHKAAELLTNYENELNEYVKPEDAGEDAPIIGDPIGREALVNELACAMIPYTPEELVEIGNREFAWCETEMKKAAEELGYGDDWLKALEYVKTLHVPPGEQPDLIKQLALEAIEYMEEHDLITVPDLAKDLWRIEMMSPERQKVNPFFTGGEVISVSFPVDSMSQEQKMMSLRGNNIHFARATVHHELIPGHHMQGYMTSRYKSYRRIFSTPFWGEGWALYWEMLLWDMGFPQTPENRIGMLFWRMHRCARIIFSLSFHLETMTPQECIDFLVDRVGHERENATAEVRRSFAGRYHPLYQAAYMLGGLQMRGMYKELVETGKMTVREFHDRIMHENTMPVEILRAIMAGQSLEKDFTSTWRFYDLET
jgi:hypothetical protein